MKNLGKFVKSYIFWTLVFGFWTWVFAGIDSCSGPKKVKKATPQTENSVQVQKRNSDLDNMIKDISDVSNEMN